MPQVVKCEVFDVEKLAGTRECGTDAFGVVGKDAFASLGLPLDDFPSFHGVLKRLVITFFLLGVFSVAHQAGSAVAVIIAPQKFADLGFTAGRRHGELHDIPHRNSCVPLLRKIDVELIQLRHRWATRAFSAPTDEA